MRITFTEEELKNLKIVHIKDHELSKEYVRDRDASWDDMVEEGRKNGKEFWNGLLYSFEGIYQNDLTCPVIYFGQMQYKDRLFKKKIGEEDIVLKYGHENLLIHCGVSLNIITKDKRFVIGRKRSSIGFQKSIYAQIGGNLNKDELQINDFSDIKKYILKETEEESGLKLNLNDVKFQQISAFDSYRGFNFVYYSNLSQEDVRKIQPTEEFLTFETLNLNEILELKEKGISDFEFSKNYLEELIK